MRQLDLFGAVEEKKPESNIEKVADADLHVVHVKEIEKEREEKSEEQEVEAEQKTDVPEVIQAEELKNLNLIYFLLRQRKFSIEGAKQYLKENKKKADVQMVLIQSLTKFRSFLLEWKAILGA